MDRAGGFGPPGRGFKSSRARFHTRYITCFLMNCMSPGIGLMDRRLKTEKDAISLAISGIIKKYKKDSKIIKTLETKYDDDAGDWYVALGWDDKRAIIKMDSVLATITEIQDI